MIYSLLYSLAFLLATPFFLLSPKARRKYLPTLAQRLGRPAGEINPSAKPSIWIHAVSVGEALAARSLVAEVRRSYPDFAILVSTTTTTGQEIARNNLEADGYFYFPFDWKFAVRRILKAINARLCIVMETELWPNFIRVLSRRRVPLVLANGRISDRSFKRYKRFRWFFRPLLRRFFILCAQSEVDAERLKAMGAGSCDIVTTGNLKYGRGQFEVPADKVDSLRKRLALTLEQRLFVAGSTHEGEEEAALNAFNALRTRVADLRLVIVPRKPERFDAVAELLQQRNIEFQRFSGDDRELAAPVVLLDTVGMLAALYRLAAVAFVGGSLIPKGGHNLLEVSAAGVPVLFGPHMHNFRGVSADVLKHDAGFQVTNGAELTEKLGLLLEDDELYRRTSEAALQVIETNQSALPQTLAAVNEAMAWSGIRSRPPAVLRALAALHGAGAALLRGDPGKELAKALQLARPVVSVGGLSFGGAAKTPMVSLLAEKLLQSSKKVALLTRGYKGGGPEPLVVSDGEGKIESPELAGDEPVMLARRHPALIVVKDSNRYRGGVTAQELFEPDIFLLDDGFQHRRLARSFNLLMLDADSIVGPRWAGQLLREPLRFASAADAIVLVGGSEGRRIAAIERLNALISDIPVYRARFRTAYYRRFDSGEALPLSDLKKMKLAGFCGIAVPSRFTESLAQDGLQVPALRTYPDHHLYSEMDVAELLHLLKVSGADAMITTEKDAVRLRILPPNLVTGLNVVVLGVNLQLDGKEELLKSISAACER